MAQPTYPGVYIQEVASGVHTITSVATSITAFVDFFREGPMNEATEVFGMTDFTRIFGGLDKASPASYAIAQFFLNGGGTALVVRVASFDGTHPLATATVGIREGGAGTAVLEVQAASEGVWGNNLRVAIDHDTLDPTNLFNLTVSRVDQKTQRPISVERHLNLSLDPAATRDVVKILKADSKLVRATVPAAAATSIPDPVGITGGDLPAAGTTARQTLLDGASAKKVQVKLPGAGGETYEATLPTWNSGAVTTLGQLASRLESVLRQALNTTPGGPTPPPSITGVTVRVVDDLRLVVVAGGGDPDFAVTDRLEIRNAGADTTATKLKLTNATATLNNVQQYPLGSATATIANTGYVKGTTGADGLSPAEAVDPSVIIGPTQQANSQGMYALDKVDLFNLLCIPCAAELGDDPKTRAVYAAAAAYCEKRRAFLLADIPESIDEHNEAKNWIDVNVEPSDHVAVYFPRVRVPDPLADFRVRSFGASGTMAGIYARTDADRGVWKAPAGIEAILRGVTELQPKLTDAENGILNPLGINALRAFPIYGLLAWGARTRRGADQLASEWKYIPVRRLALMLEESLFRATKWVVFEPNDEPLWANIRLNVSAYMLSLFRQGAFQGTSPKEAFFVKCDAETTTQDDRNKGIVNILVGFAPLKPAEFVMISIQQMRGDL